MTIPCPAHCPPLGVAFKKKAFDLIGLYPDTGYGAEENYLALRLFLNNKKLIFLPEVMIHHQPSQIRDHEVLLMNKTKNDIIWAWSFAPMILFFPLFVWKSFSWLRLGAHLGYVNSVFRGLLNAISEISKQNMLKRETVSASKYLNFIMLRRKDLAKDSLQ